MGRSRRARGPIVCTSQCLSVAVSPCVQSGAPLTAQFAPLRVGAVAVAYPESALNLIEGHFGVVAGNCCAAAGAVGVRAAGTTEGDRNAIWYSDRYLGTYLSTWCSGTVSIGIFPGMCCRTARRFSNIKVGDT